MVAFWLTTATWFEECALFEHGQPSSRGPEKRRERLGMDDALVQGCLKASEVNDVHPVCACTFHCFNECETTSEHRMDHGSNLGIINNDS